MLERFRLRNDIMNRILVHSHRLGLIPNRRVLLDSAVWRFASSFTEDRNLRPEVCVVHRDTVPEGYPRGISHRFEKSRSTSLLNRDVDRMIEETVLAPLLAEPNQDSQRDSRQPTEEYQKNMFILDGEQGVGKSISLLQAVICARRKGIITMYVPSARTWTHGEGFFAATVVDGRNSILDGPSIVRFYDRPTQTLALLDGLLTAHGTVLASLPLTLDSHLRKEHQSLRNVRDLVAFGVNILRDVDSDWREYPAKGADALSYVIRELSSQATIPFLIAIDDYESFLGLTSMVSSDKRCLHADGIRVVSEHFGRSSVGRTASSLKRGALLLSLSKSCSVIRCRASRVRGTVDSPISDDVRNDPSGAAWISSLRKLSLTQEDQSIDKVLGSDWNFDPVAVSAVNTSTYAQIVDIPEWSVDEARKLILGLERNKESVMMNEDQREKLIVLAGGRGNILHKLIRCA